MSEGAAVDTGARILQRAAPLPASGHAFKPKPVAETFKRLQLRLANHEKALKAGMKHAEGEMKALLERVCAAYREAPTKLDVLTEAAAYRLLALPHDYRDEHGGELFARYWLAKEGGPFALRALATAGTLSRVTTEKNTWADPKELWVAARPHDDTLSWGKSDDVWLPIREWVASIEPAELDAMHDLVATLRKDLHPGARAALDAALGDPDFCAEDARDIVASMGNTPPIILWPTLCSMTDVAAISAILGHAQVGAYCGAGIDYLPNLVVRLGADAAAPLTELLMTARGTFGSDRTKGIASVLALIRTKGVAATMASCIGDKDLRAIATDYLQSVPELAIAPLAGLAVGKGALSDLARPVLGAVVAKAPDAARAASGLTEAERAAVDKALERLEGLDEADASSLPKVLAAPPWLEKKKAKPPRTVAGLALLPHAARVVWKSEAERTTAKNERPHYAPNPAAEKEILKEIETATKAGKAASIGCYKLMQLPKESALHTLETAPLAIFSWYYDVASAFIGRYELEALKAVLRYATIDPTQAVTALGVVDAPEVAPLMADAVMRLKKSRSEAQAWLLRFPETAAIGLIPDAIGDRAGSRPPATAALRWLASHGKREVIEKVGARYGEEAKAALADVLDFDPLLDLPPKIPKLPPFFNAAALARPRLEGTNKVLSAAAVEALGTMLAFLRVDDAYAGLAQVKEACDAESLAEFAWDLFQAWLVAGAPSKEQWALLALAHLGDDETARKLTPLIRAWPGEAAHARAVVGLDVLAAIGTDVALMHLHGVAQKVKFKGLQEKARLKIDQIAEARGLTADELGDRLVPDLGLDDDGSLVLDFGPRKFRVVFDETLKPSVVDESGKRGDLPKPKQSDDAEKAAAATATWKALKKDAKTVASTQLTRLELAMCGQRRWKPEDFERFFVRHPLLVHLVGRLIWGAYDDGGALLGTFRVADDGSFADVADARFELPKGARVGLVHRLQMDQTEADRWGQVLGDYEIMQPFAQLSREAIEASSDEHGATELTRVTGVKVPTGKVLGLDARGWRRGPPQDGGVVCWYEKPLGEGWVACVDLDPGIYTGMIAESPEQTLGKCVVAKDGDMWRRESLKKLGELSPVQFSELVRDLESVR